MRRKTPEFSFGADPLVVMGAMYNAIIRFGDQEAKVIEPEFYTRAENDESVYKVLTQVREGLMVGVPYRGSVLPLISAIEGNAILIREIVITGGEKGRQRITGPGRVSKALGINNGDQISLTVEDPTVPIFRLS